MATYLYESIPEREGEKPRRFELQHSMKDDALTRHPETGEAIRRIMVGGLGLPGSLVDPKSEPSPRSHRTTTRY